MPPAVHIAPEVAAAVADGRAVVALESTIIAHGLPRPDNLRVARELEQVVRDAGAVPATVGMLGGTPTVGLDDSALERLATSDDVAKLSIRDLAIAATQRRDGATTVAATAHLAAHAGIRLFATGGLGGVHREARDTWDESADLVALAGTPVAVVCAGVKSILDVGATLERLESLNVPVIGYGTHRFPGFYLADSGHVLDWRVDSPEELAEVLATQRALGPPRQGTVVANPVPVDQQLDPALHEEALRTGLERVRREGVTGKAVTPLLLEHLNTITAGAAVRVNVALVRSNADLAARTAVALTRQAP
jgi:pseudouridylate synthase